MNHGTISPRRQPIQATRSKSIEKASIKSFPCNLDSEIQEIKLTGENINSFKGMKTFQLLKSLYADNTHIASYCGACKQPSLQSLYLTKTPLAKSYFYRIMALIVFGDSIQTIDGRQIKESERTTANHLRSDLERPLVNGWILYSVNPVRILNPITQKRRIITLKSEKTSSENSTKDSEGNSSNKKRKIVHKKRPVNKCSNTQIQEKETEETDKPIPKEQITDEQPTNNETNNVEEVSLENNQQAVKEEDKPDHETTPPSQVKKMKLLKRDPLDEWGAPPEIKYNPLPKVPLIAVSGIDFEQKLQHILFDGKLKDIVLKSPLVIREIQHSQDINMTINVFAKTIVFAASIRPLFIPQIVSLAQKVPEDTKSALSQSLVEIISSFTFPSHTVYAFLLEQLVIQKVIEPYMLQYIFVKVAQGFKSWNSLFTLIDGDEAPSMPFIQFFKLFKHLLSQIDPEFCKSLEEQLKTDIGNGEVHKEDAELVQKFKWEDHFANNKFIDVLNNDDVEAFQLFEEEEALFVLDMTPWIASENVMLSTAAFAGSKKIFNFIFDGIKKKNSLRMDDLLPYVCVAGGNEKIIQTAQSIGIDLDIALSTSVQFHRFDFFVSQNISDADPTELYELALKYSNYKVIQYLMHTGSQIKIDPFVAIESEDCELLHFFTMLKQFDVNQQFEGKTLIDEALKSDNSNLVRLVLSVPSLDVNALNSEGAPPLCAAIENEALNSILLILQHDEINVNLPDESGFYPIHRAIQTKKPKIIDMLLRRQDLDINAQDGEGKTALYMATENQDWDLIKQLRCIHGLNPNIKARNGFAPIHSAVSLKSITTIRNLLDLYKIDINLENDSQETALQMAIKMKSLQIVNVLLSHKRIKVNLGDVSLSEESSPEVAKVIFQWFDTKEKTNNEKEDGESLGTNVPEQKLVVRFG